MLYIYIYNYYLIINCTVNYKGKKTCTDSFIFLLHCVGMYVIVKLAYTYVL